MDLFWALRGAGAGNFGVVTSLVFRTVPAPDATNFHLAWPYSHAVPVIEAWQGWAPAGPDDLAASLKVTATGDIDEPPSVDMYGALLGTESEAKALVEELVVRAGSYPTSVSRTHMSFPETRRVWAQLGVAEDGAEEGPHPQLTQPRYLFSKSEFFGRPLSTEAIAALVDTSSAGLASGASRELDFLPWGGAYHHVRPVATAFVHRHVLFQLYFAGVGDP